MYTPCLLSAAGKTGYCAKQGARRHASSPDNTIASLCCLAVSAPWQEPGQPERCAQKSCHYSDLPARFNLCSDDIRAWLLLFSRSLQTTMHWPAMNNALFHQSRQSLSTSSKKLDYLTSSMEVYLYSSLKLLTASSSLLDLSTLTRLNNKNVNWPVSGLMRCICSLPAIRTIFRRQLK